MIEEVLTDKAPRPIGPYSQAIRSSNMLFVSGQLPIDPTSGRIVDGGIEEQTRRVLENIRAIVEAAGFSMSNIVIVYVYLRDLSLFEGFNRVYAEYFRAPRPARVVVAVSDIPKGALLEVSAIACRG